MNDLTGVIDPTHAAELVAALIVALFGGAGNSVVGVFLTGLLKRFLPNADPRKLSFGVALGLTAAMYGAMLTGRVAQFNSFFQWLMVVVPPTLTLLSGFGLQSVLHEKAHANRVPVAGYKRSPSVDSIPF